MRGYMWIICKYYAILYKRLEYHKDFHICGGPGISPPQIPRDNCTLEKIKPTFGQSLPNATPEMLSVVMSTLPSDHSGQVSNSNELLGSHRKWLKPLTAVPSSPLTSQSSYLLRTTVHCLNNEKWQKFSR
jgi:hypothetical protein